MKRHKLLFILPLITLFVSCKNNSKSVPENNNFSYLDSNTHQESNLPLGSNSTSTLNSKDLKCDKIHTELIGSIIVKNISSPSTTQPEYRKSNILSLNTAYILSCADHQQISSNEIILNLNQEINIEQYLGGTVIAIGEISKVKDSNSSFPLEMNVIRIEVTKGSIK